jgi:carbamoyltransferase
VPAKRRILGVSAYYHDSAAALIEDGEIIAASQEERFTRIKGDSSFPHHAVAFCLDRAGIAEDEVDYVVFYENPHAKFERLLSTYHHTAPSSLSSFLRSMPSWLTRKLWLGQNMRNELGINKRVYFCDHHLSHAASAFYPSPFQEAAILTIDGVGEWSTSTYGVGRGKEIDLLQQIRFPNSAGLLYSAFTYYTGFKINSGEYKLMGLAPYGTPKYAHLIEEHLVRIKEDGSIVLNQKYFNYVGGLTMTNERFHSLFGAPPRKPESMITQKEMDLASSIQSVLNKIILRMGNYVHEKTKQKNLVLAGGVALNVVSMGLLSTEGPFDNIWIQPAAGDAGAALGAAYWLWYQLPATSRHAMQHDAMEGAFLGFEIEADCPDDDEMLNKLGAVWHQLSEEDLAQKVSDEIEKGRIIAIARGAAEFGPRALGHRSILADARDTEMQSRLNLKVKFRESFRPFAPMVIEEDSKNYFDARQTSPYMLFVYFVNEALRKKTEDRGLFGINLLKQTRSEIPAVTHVDYSARLQTIDEKRNPFMASVLCRFKEKTGCSVIVNTSFNVRGEPIVNTAEDAYRCFMATDIDSLVIGNRFFSREEQNSRAMSEEERQSWLKRFALD